MLLTIAFMVTATVLFAVYVLSPRLGDTRVIFDHAPDHPLPFGYNMAWLAVRTRDTQAVVRALGVTHAEPCNWRTGLGTVYDHRLGNDHVFITPPVNGWTFVASLALPPPAARNFSDKCMPLLRELASEFVEVQYYFICAPIDLYAWARMVDGKLMRAFAIGGDGIIWNRARPTREERALGLKLLDVRGVSKRKGDLGGELILYPTEDHVLQLASRWSIDPSKLQKTDVTAPSIGVIAIAPKLWQAELLRKTAA